MVNFKQNQNFLFTLLKNKSKLIVFLFKNVFLNIGYFRMSYSFRPTLHYSK